MRTKAFAGCPKPENSPKKNSVLKRSLDIGLSLLGLILLLPAIFLIGLSIKMEDGGPIFYRGVRVGKDGLLFGIFKFRTMVRNAEKMGGPSTANDDPRITHVGKWIRRYKLDEIPQLINVLRGDMSLVGPRPEVKAYVDLFTREEKKILSVRPGITDWASLWNSDEGAVLAGSADPEKTYLEKIRPEKIRLQLRYVNKRSFFTDLKIIFLTLKTILLRRNAIPS